MRKKQTFLLTVLPPETEDASFCGKLKVISSGKTCTFTSLADLYDLITSETGGEDHQNTAQFPEASQSQENVLGLQNVVDQSGEF